MLQNPPFRFFSVRLDPSQFKGRPLCPRAFCFMDLLQHVRAAAFAGSVQLLAGSRWALQPPAPEVLPQTRPPGLQCQAILSPPRLLLHHLRRSHPRSQRVRKTSLPRQCKRSQPRVSSNLSLIVRGQPANLLQGFRGNDSEHVDVDRIVLKGVDPAFRHRMNARNEEG